MRRAGALLAVLLAFAGGLRADGWQVFKSDRFGFAMLVAPGTAWAAQDWGGGWGGMRAQRGELVFLGIVKMGSFATPAVLERDAIAVTKVPGPAWQKTDEGRNANGWKWWRTYKARLAGQERVLFAVLGTGPRGSYMLLLETSEGDFARNAALYDQWYRSLTLY
jgi:hypothetical protein